MGRKSAMELERPSIVATLLWAFGIFIIDFTKGDEQNGQKSGYCGFSGGESAEKPNEEIESEIVEELSREPARIPWMKEVETVTVTEI